MSDSSEGYANVTLKGGEYERILTDLRVAHKHLATVKATPDKVLANELLLRAIRTLSELGTPKQRRPVR